MGAKYPSLCLETANDTSTAKAVAGNMTRGLCSPWGSQAVSHRPQRLHGLGCTAG